MENLDQVCLFAQKDHIVTLTLNRPQSANAMSKALVQQLGQHLQVVQRDPQVRALILTGAGDRVFCAGADLKERATMAAEDVPIFLAKARDFIDQLAQLRCPTIAALNGSAFGGGLELALACDLRIAADDIKVGLTETSLAIIPGAGGTQRLPRLVGVARAKELILTARRITAERAAEIALVNEVVPRQELAQRAWQVAMEIAGNGPVAVAQAKLAIDGGIEMPLEKALSYEQECYAPTLETRDRLEAIAAFIEKRPARFEGQ